MNNTYVKGYYTLVTKKLIKLALSLLNQCLLLPIKVHTNWRSL